ncbi:MAG: hypothetical protein WEF28_06530 [Acidimicrobiia bacterium]
MYPLNDRSEYDYRVGRLQMSTDNRRMARSAKAGGVMVRNGHSFRGAIGNGLIALGERLAEPPSANQPGMDRAA